MELILQRLHEDSQILPGREVLPDGPCVEAGHDAVQPDVLLVLDLHAYVERSYMDDHALRVVSRRGGERLGEARVPEPLNDRTWPRRHGVRPVRATRGDVDGAE